MAAGDSSINAIHRPIIKSHAVPPSLPDEAVSFVLPEDLQWEIILPALGERSPKHAILRQDEQSGATTMLVWIPRNFHVPLHWHTGSEKHYVLQGTLRMECAGQQVLMNSGSFNYMPARQPHQAWTLPDEDCLLLNDVNTRWDVNWLNEPPHPVG